jgi:hypothetical protein
MSNADLSEAHRHYAVLRDLIIHQPGGWADAETLARVQRACRAANDTLDDGECRERLGDIERYAADLYSRTGHYKWARSATSGADVLRLLILRELNAFDARVIVLQELRRSHAPLFDASRDRKPR